MEEIVSLSMAGVYSLLILNLTFLFLLGIRIRKISSRMLHIEETLFSQNKLLNERIELLENAKKIK